LHLFFFPLTKVSKIFILFFVTKSHPNGYIHVTNDESNKTERFTMETLYRENVKIVSHYLYSMCKDEELTKDLTQETFLRAYESLERFDGNCKISTWLCQIAKHLLYQTYAKAGRQVPMETEELKQKASGLVKDNTEHVAITRIELIDCLKELQKLPEQMREVMYLRVMSDLSYREIGEIMGKSENWARVNFYRAKELLLKGCGRDE